MPVEILVIDDTPKNHEHPWVYKINLTGNTGYYQQGDTCNELLFKLDDLIRNKRNSRAFDGTILDMRFQGESFGGIELWEELIANGLRPFLGELMVITNSNTVPGAPIHQFADRHAGGRLCVERDHKDFSMQHLCRFLQTLPNAEHCSRRILQDCGAI